MVIAEVLNKLQPFSSSHKSLHFVAMTTCEFILVIRCVKALMFLPKAILEGNTMNINLIEIKGLTKENSLALPSFNVSLMKDLNGTGFVQRQNIENRDIQPLHR